MVAYRQSLGNGIYPSLCSAHPTQTVRANQALRYSVQQAKREKLGAIKNALGLRQEKQEKKDWKEVSATALGWTPDQCPCCKQMTMVRVIDFDHRGPPAHYISCLTPKTAPHTGQSQSA